MMAPPSSVAVAAAPSSPTGASLTGQEPAMDEVTLEVLDLPLEELLGVGLRVTAVLVIGFPLLFLASRWARKSVGNRFNPQWGLISSKVVFYAGLVLILVSALRELGIELTPLLGAAGIVGIAVGFASQTSVSNMISGLFLIAEQPFAVDDLVQVGDTVGRVLSIDLMSVKIRTFDNRYVRIPNETLIKSEVITITRFPIRRMDVNVGVAYREDISRVRQVLLDVAAENPQVLMEPAPMVWFDGFGDSSIDLRLAVWGPQETFYRVRAALREEVKARFDAEDIEIPFPHRTLYTGSVTDPFPVRLGPDGRPDGAEEVSAEVPGNDVEAPDPPDEKGADDSASDVQP